MLSPVTYPNIKPLRTFSDSSNRHTTITSFDDVLNDKEKTIKTTDTDNNKINEKNSSDNDKDVIYTNPKTGDVYKYKDVADESNNSIK